VQTFLRRLAGIDLAAWEFPFEWKAHRGASPGGKHEPVTFYYGASHMDMLLDDGPLS
jgi:hypothetical protein